MALQTIGDLFIFLFATYQGFYTYKGFTYSLHMNSLNIFVDFSNLHVLQGTKDLARHATFSRCVRVMGSSKFRSCGFYLDESQFLNYVYFIFVVVS
ncbi:hypothetical protein Hdeb2414_s0019g00541731 [Helianthus debilis subsp. tardiflorus]